MYKGLQGELYEYLKSEPRARERSLKDRAIVNLLNKRYPVLETKESRIAFVQDYNSLDRYWRLLTAEHIELRGSDYETKRIVEERKQKEIGYESGFYQLKNLKIC